LHSLGWGLFFPSAVIREPFFTDEMLGEEPEQQPEASWVIISKKPASEVSWE
jgi:hypothetical protein